MTQLELADKMGISFQAVSNWERGTSMPDISKLPELAELFGVTIDCLLGEHSEVIDKAVSGNMRRCFEDNLISLNEICEIAPMLRPDQIDAICESEQITDLREIEDLFPFLGTSAANNLAIKAAKSEKYKDLELIAPFVSKELIGNLALKLYEEAGIAALNDIAPFIPNQQLSQIAELEYINNGLHYFDSIAPFLNRDYLNELAQQEFLKHGIKSISNLAPFLDKNILSKFIKKQYLT